MLGPFATASRRTPIHQVSLLSHARIDVHDNDNAWQRGPLWPHRIGPTIPRFPISPMHCKTLGLAVARLCCCGKCRRERVCRPIMVRLSDSETSEQFAANKSLRDGGNGVDWPRARADRKMRRQPSSMTTVSSIRTYIRQSSALFADSIPSCNQSRLSQPPVGINCRFWTISTSGFLHLGFSKEYLMTITISK